MKKIWQAMNENERQLQRLEPVGTDFVSKRHVSTLCILRVSVYMWLCLCVRERERKGLGTILFFRVGAQPTTDSK